MKVMWVVGTLSETGISILADKIIKSFTGKQSRGCSNFIFSFSLSFERKGNEEHWHSNRVYGGNINGYNGSGQITQVFIV